MVADEDVTLRLREPGGDLSGRDSVHYTGEVSYADEDYSQNLRDNSIDESRTEWHGKVRTERLMKDAGETPTNDDETSDDQGGSQMSAGGTTAVSSAFTDRSDGSRTDENGIRKDRLSWTDDSFDF
ncbi:hypothetical protein QAD02_003009 [Eretmocerus hayati]|uniref:Uncharacterized protein n=1 Tax=Eretmocerus hayati TaxID=131215 RepID=A0ACC2NKQ6_9HYME|nr:hypothetical protein QAD02_003009 [Eretmocerus hayati]